MYLRIIILLLPLFSFTACSTSSNSIKLSKKCYKKGVTGMCRGYFIKYEYNEKTKKCQHFVYGGCGGNIPFNTLDECKKSCEE
ncbi:BPTI/Kunitz domain-containing protein [Arcobacter sp. LA11]|uniref:BPTI/Kunitz domain-containing protein n=1 Tax=Arcobacter sp. LA11 TaxID=1898176 RepID=UPI0009326C95|nr:BPTI/Kunitz domain-containing protein [Arcobacter sp. LA11]